MSTKQMHNVDFQSRPTSCCYSPRLLSTPYVALKSSLRRRRIILSNLPTLFTLARLPIILSLSFGKFSPAHSFILDLLLRAAL